MFLTKLLPVFVYPLGLAIAIGLAGLVLRPFLPRLARLATISGLAGLWLASMPAVANLIQASLEADYPPIAFESIAEAEVAVVLGGAVEQPLPPRLRPDLGDAVERITEAARLYRLGKVRHILVSGGNMPWETTVHPEAELIAGLLSEFGVPREAIVTEGASRNTYENAVNSAVVFQQQGWRTGLLVTSAFHMKRANATFQRSGLSLIPVPVDVRARRPFADSALDFFPDAKALSRTTEAVKEHIALLVYRLRGWA